MENREVCSIIFLEYTINAVIILLVMTLSNAGAICMVSFKIREVSFFICGSTTNKTLS